MQLGPERIPRPFFTPPKQKEKVVGSLEALLRLLGYDRIPLLLRRCSCVLSPDFPVAFAIATQLPRMSRSSSLGRKDLVKTRDCHCECEVTRSLCLHHASKTFPHQISILYKHKPEKETFKGDGFSHVIVLRV